MKRYMTIFLLGCCAAQAHFSTLQELVSYAGTHKEDIKSDNNDWADPRYMSYYKGTTAPWKKIGRSLGLITESYWNPQEFKNLIKKVTAYRIEHIDLMQDIITLSLNPGQKCVVFGDLHGAYHSLVRNLQELKKMGIIDDNLKVINEDYHIIFLGNIINRSPYSLGTLTVVLNLMEKNPERVIYLRGKEEHNKYWENFTMRRALKVRAQAVADKEDGVVPLESAINAFFKTLPRMVKIKQADSQEAEAMYCVHTHISLEELRAKDVMAVLYGERYENVNPSLELNGLRRIGFTSGTSMWSLMSSPVQLYQEFLSFYYDAFVVIEMGKKIQQSTITLYNNDVRTPEDYTATMRDILFGRTLQDSAEFKINPLFINKPLDIGSTLDLSGMAFSYGGDIKRGTNLAFRERNFGKGVQDHFVLPSFFDDGYVAQEALRNVETLIKDYNIQTLLTPLGTGTLLTYLDKIKKGDVSVFFPVSGAKILRAPALKNIIHFKASHADELRALIDYMITKYGSQKFAFFYQTDAYGKDALDAAHAELKKRGITEWTDVPYSREQTDFKEAADKVRAFNPDTIGLLSVSLPTQAFVGELGTDYLLKRHIFGTSFLESADLRRFLDDRGIIYTFAFIVPDPAKSDLPIVQNYRKAMDADGAPYSSNSLEGWIAAQILLDAMDHVQKPITREKIMTYLESLKDYNLGGLILTFNPKTRSFELPVYIENEKNEFLADASVIKKSKD